MYFEQESEIEIFKTCFKTQRPLLLKGPTGCGKTQLVEHMAGHLERPLIKVACNEDTNSADLLGRYILKNGETVWQDGPVTRALKENALLYLDEIAEAREDVIVALHPLTDQRREIYLDKINVTLKAEREFMLVASYNPGYQQGAKELKPSTRQRFISFSMKYLPPEKEKDLLCTLTQIDSSMALQLVKFADKVRKMTEFPLKETISTRLLVNAALFIKEGMNPRLAGHVAIAEGLTDDPDLLRSLKELVNLNF